MRLARKICAIAIWSGLGAALLDAHPLSGQMTVSGSIRENDMYPGLHPGLVFLIPPGPEEQSLFACLSANDNDGCKDEVGAAAASGHEVQVVTRRTGPKSYWFQTVGEIPAGNYFLFMFGRAQGVIPVSNQPYDNYFYGMQLLQVTADIINFDVQFMPVEYYSR